MISEKKFEKAKSDGYKIIKSIRESFDRDLINAKTEEDADYIAKVYIGALLSSVLSITEMFENGCKETLKESLIEIIIGNIK